MFLQSRTKLKRVGFQPKNVLNDEVQGYGGFAFVATPELQNMIKEINSKYDSSPSLELSGANQLGEKSDLQSMEN